MTWKTRSAKVCLKMLKIILRGITGFGVTNTECRSEKSVGSYHHGRMATKEHLYERQTLISHILLLQTDPLSFRNLKLHN